MRLDFDSLYTKAAADAFEGAKHLFYNNRIRDIAQKKQGKRVAVSALVDKKKTLILFDEVGSLYNYSCTCNNGTPSSGPCQHVLATALSFEEKNPQTSQGKLKGTDTAALKLISEYAFTKERQPVASEKLPLYPLLFAQDDSLRLKLFIGRKKYKIKNISNFLSLVNKREFHRYGIELAFYHGREKFDGSSVKLFDLLESSFLEKSNLGIADQYKDSFTLMQNDVDLFFEIFQNQTVGVQKDVRTSAFVHDNQDEIKLALHIQKKSRGFSLELSTRNIQVFWGRKYGYLLNGSGIYRCSRYYMNIVLPLLNMYKGRQNLYVTQKDMALFYNNVIYKVAEFIQIDSDTDLSIYEMPALNAKLYLESDGLAASARLECFYDQHKVDIFSDYYADQLVRDWQQESLLQKAIEKYFPFSPLLRLEDEEDIYNLIAFGLPEINKYAEIFVVESSLLKLRRSPKVSVGIRLNSELLDVEILSEEFSQKDLNNILSSLKKDKKYVRLTDGSFVTLSDPLFSSIKQINSLGGEYTTRFSLPKFYAPYLDEQLTGSYLEYTKSDSFKSMLEDISSYDAKDFALPPQLDSIMRSYQKSGFKWLTTIKQQGLGGILADDMGLGKSLQLISLILSEKSFPTLIVCPTSLILNWVEEFIKFAPNLKVLPIMGSAAARAADIQKINQLDVVITSYKLLARDIQLYQHTKFICIAADEAQFIKNPSTTSSRAIKNINSEYKFALTGTPIENNMSELWSIFDFIMPNYLGKYPQFSKRFEQPLLQGNKNAAEKLLRLTSPFILRRMKTDVLPELPPKIESEITIALEDEQRNMYLENLAIIKHSASEDSKVAVLAHLTKLRQICCDPSIIQPNYMGNSAKTDAALEIIQSAASGGHKILLFSQFVSMLDILKQKLTQLGVSHYLLKGDTPKPERMRLVKRFNSDLTSVFLISLKAGGTGLNLTGADVVILYDPWWNEAVMNQATDRAYRIGQEKSVQVYKLIMENTIEQKILKLQQKKTALSSFVTSSPDSLSFEKIMQLLE